MDTVADCDHDFKFNGGDPMCWKCGLYQREYSNDTAFTCPRCCERLGSIEGASGCEDLQCPIR